MTDMKISISNFYIKKPSPLFFLMLLISILFWYFIGDITWRHVDDYGPLQDLFEAEKPEDFLRLFILGWGSYPPIWEYFTFFSYIFKPFGIDVVRNICLFFGLFSLSISSFLTYSICLLINQQSRKINIFEKNNYFIEIFSVLFNLLSPEIFLHSNSNMPYNLATITIQLIIILMIVIVNNNIIKTKSSDYIFIDKKFLILFTIFGITLTFQSTIIIFAFISTLLIYVYYSKIKLNFKYFYSPISILGSYNNLFNSIKIKNVRRLTYLALSFFILIYLFKFFVMLVVLKKQPGFWAKGINYVYDISIFSNDPLNILNKLIYSLKSIVTQSLYPFRISQVEVSFFYFGSLIYAYYVMYKKNTLSKYFSLFSMFCVIATVGLSLSGKFILSPTRHTIFIYPIVWIPIIITLENFFIGFKYKLYKISIIFLLITFYFFGSYFSIKDISYTKFDNSNLINLLKESDFYAPKSYNLFSGNLSLYSTQINKLTNEKKCQESSLNLLNEYNIFVYSHTNPFIGDDKQIKHLIEENKECFKANSKISILKKIEKKNIKEIEQNNLIRNGGSSLYAYILRVQNK